MRVGVVIVLEVLVNVAPQVNEIRGEGDKYSFHFDYLCFFAFGVFFFLACASMFIIFLNEGTGWSY